MWNFKLLAATRTVEATMPFMLYRLAVCLGTAAASLLAALIGAGTLIAFASFSAKPGGVASFGAALGLGAFAFLVYRYRGRLFFNIQAGHLALLAELARGAKLPQGKAQIELAKQKASQIFPSPLVFLDLSETAKQVLRALPAKHCPFLGHLPNRQAYAAFLPVAGLLAQTGEQPLLALSFRDGQTNPWQAVRDGLIAHVRHFDLLTKNRLYLLAFEYLGLAAAYLAMLYPTDSAAALLPVDVGVWRYVFALIFAWSLKAAFLEPIATTALAGLYFDLAKPGGNAAESQALEGDSEAFRKIIQKASL